MEFLKIDQTDSDRWDQVWQLYEESFPLAERRKVDDHLRACNDPRFYPLSVWEDGRLIGILFYWEWDSYRYLEYLAVSPDLKGQGYGSQILHYLRDSNHTIILEIDPLVNELSVRRLQFYEKSGFTLTPYRFMHLPYRKDSEPQELLILSYPKMITRKEYADFIQFVNESVIVYCE
ncbi:MAG TPA: N-acetyltransferase [Porphyromonadaceae bacterium]|jgi:GNAT superfamily N-acetyltransferase|nr:N-acetyltransferase [Porphyromonadaceae bacterium]HBL33958.1 N-acetyltransferase [Porphyromonadaceae bacterium]HBX18877.1 N-acetyltransferase [Porphyromonadaceae bacterium]HCM21168.1 N-acetyltransferase [Porphyromonadaceae bacterium]